MAAMGAREQGESTPAAGDVFRLGQIGLWWIFGCRRDHRQSVRLADFGEASRTQFVPGLVPHLEAACAERPEDRPTAREVLDGLAEVV